MEMIVPNHKHITIINTNVGSLGQNNKLTDGNRIVRRKLVDSMTEARAKYASDHVVVLVQESGAYDVELPQPFGLPVATDEKVNFGKKVGGKRGVCIYASWSQVKPFEIDHLINEVCAVTAPFKNNKGDKSEALIINVYRNISKGFRRTVDQTVEAVHKLIDKAKSQNISQFIICGDFNSVSSNIGKGAVELFHPEWFHQANENAARKYIDKALSNMPNSGILEIKPTCENITSSGHLGHKCAVIFIGRMPAGGRPDLKEIVSISRIRKEARKCNPRFENFDQQSTEGLKGMAQEITTIILDIMDRSKVSFKPTGNHTNRVTLIKDLIEQEDQVLTRHDASEKLYKVVDTLKKSRNFDTAIEDDRPPLTEIAQTLIDKLRDLYPGDPLETLRIVYKRFPLTSECHFGTLPTRNEIGNIMLQTSNSGATDYLGMSLKMTKTVFSQNPKLKNRMRDICVGCIQTGYFPEVWTTDQISFLYKNKGSRSDPTK